MSTADHAAPDRPESDVAAELEAATFVRLVTSPDGDALAATGVLARLLDSPFQARISRSTAGESEADVTVGVGTAVGDVAITDRPLAERAVEIARTLSERPLSPALRALALAGIVAAERTVADHADLFEPLGVERDPGVGVPTTDVVDGLAHTTLVHAPFSGDVDATARAVSGIDAESDLASLLAVSVLSEPHTNASVAVERALHPHVVETDDCPFATLAGYADVLDALARSAPGEGLALAIGRGDPERALACWREHAETVHAAVRDADIDRYPDCVVADVAGTPLAAVETVARLIRAYRSPEPVVLATTDRVVVATARRSERELTAPLRAAVSASSIDGTVTGRERYARAAIQPEEPVVAAFREAV